jgi:predicted nucleotidyltransferase
VGAEVPGIQQAWLYGSFAKKEADSASDIDVLLIGEPDQAELAVRVRGAEKILRREINYTVFTPKDLKRRLRNGDALVTDIWNGKRVGLIGRNGQISHRPYGTGGSC